LGQNLRQVGAVAATATDRAADLGANHSAGRTEEDEPDGHANGSA